MSGSGTGALSSSGCFLTQLSVSRGKEQDPPQAISGGKWAQDLQELLPWAGASIPGTWHFGSSAEERDPTDVGSCLTAGKQNLGLQQKSLAAMEELVGEGEVCSLSRDASFARI